MGHAEDVLRARQAAESAREQQDEASLARQIAQLWSEIKSEGAVALERLAQQGYPGGELVGLPGKEKARWEVGRFYYWFSGEQIDERVYLYSEGDIRHKNDPYIYGSLSLESKLDQLTAVLESIRNFAR